MRRGSIPFNLCNSVAEVASYNVAAKIVFRDTPQVFPDVFAALDHFVASCDLTAQFGKPPCQHPDIVLCVRIKGRISGTLSALDSVSRLLPLLDETVDLVHGVLFVGKNIFFCVKPVPVNKPRRVHIQPHSACVLPDKKIDAAVGSRSLCRKV